MKHRKYAKCPRCCPDGGAIFHREYRDSDNHPVWVCCNCSFVKKARLVAAPDHPTPGQERIIHRLANAFGEETEIEVSMIGRMAFVKLTNDSRNWYDGTVASITVHPNGRFNMHLYRFGGDVEIKDWIAVSVYLKEEINNG